MKGKDDKKKLDKQYEDLDRVLGNPYEISIGDKALDINCISMKNFSEFMKNMLNINYNSLWLNYLDNDEVAGKSLERVIEMSFKDEKLEQIMELINSENYPEIMKKIIEINGIKLQDDSKGTGDSEAKKD